MSLRGLRLNYSWLTLLFVVSLFACSGAQKFKINGELVDGSSTNLYVRYYGNDAVQTGVTAAHEGKFVAEFSAPVATIVEILDNDHRVLGRLFLKNGDEVNITIDRSNPFNNKVTGNEVNEQWAAVLNENAEALSSGDHALINDVIEKYIAANPDNAVSTLLFASLYDASANPIHADSILGMISPDVRYASVLGPYQAMIQRYVNSQVYGPIADIKYRNRFADSTCVFSASDKKASLLVISNEVSKHGDSIVPHIRSIYKDFDRRKLQILDIACFADTSSWKRVVARDSAEWIQGWVPGGVLGEGLDQLAIPAIPYYIVADSLGNQLYRGTSPDEARSQIKKILNQK